METLVVGSRVPLLAVLMVKDLLPNQSAITLVTPSLDEIVPFVSSVIVRNGIPDAKRTKSLEILCPLFEEDLIVEAVKRPLEGHIRGLVEVRPARGVGKGGRRLGQVHKTVHRTRVLWVVVSYCNHRRHSHGLDENLDPQLQRCFAPNLCEIIETPTPIRQRSGCGPRGRQNPRLPVLAVTYVTLKFATVQR